MSLFRQLYPSELENIIDELDKEDKLNKVHLKNLNQYISKTYIISISFSLSLFFSCYLFCFPLIV